MTHVLAERLYDAKNGSGNSTQLDLSAAHASLSHEPKIFTVRNRLVSCALSLKGGLDGHACEFVIDLGIGAELAVRDVTHIVVGSISGFSYDEALLIVSHVSATVRFVKAIEERWRSVAAKASTPSVANDVDDWDVPF